MLNPQSFAPFGNNPKGKRNPTLSSDLQPPKPKQPSEIPTYYKNLIEKHELGGVNIPKETPDHPTKSHMVLVYHGGKFMLKRFGAQGAKTYPPREGESEEDRRRRESFKARHRHNIERGPTSAAYWADKVKW